MISKIEIQNLKGVSGTFALQPFNIVHSPRNGVGKTAIIDAVTLALLGWHPRYGKTAAAIYSIASDKSMSVIAHRGDKQVSMSWVKTGSKVTQTKSEEPNTPACMLDFSSYQKLTARERAAFVFERSEIDPSTFNFSTVSNFLGTIDCSKDGARTAFEDMTELVRNSIATARRTNQLLPEWLAGVIEGVIEAGRNTKALIKASEGTAQTAVEQSATMVIPREVKQTEVSAVNSRLGTATAKMQLKAAAIRKQQESQAELDRVTVELTKALGDDSLADLVSLRDQIATSIDEAKKRLGPMPSPTQSNSELVSATRQRDEATREVARARRVAEECASKVEAIKGGKPCPCCGALKEHWGTVDMTALNSALNEAADKLTKCIAEESSLANEVVRLKDVYDLKLKQCDQWDESMEEVRSDMATLATLTKRIDKINDLSRFRVDQTMIDAEGTLEELTKAVEDCRAEVTKVSAEYKAWVEFEAHNAQVARAEKDGQSRRDRLEFIEALRVGLVELQSKLAEATIGAILENARKLTDGILKFQLSYNDGEFGYTKNGRWIGSDTLSGAETRIAFAGIQLAFAIKHPERILMIDELGVLGEEMKHQFLDRVAELIDQGVIHQFIGVDVNKPRVFAGENIITL